MNGFACRPVLKEAKCNLKMAYWSLFFTQLHPKRRTLTINLNEINTTPVVESDGCSSSSSLEDNCSIAWDSTATNPSLKSSNVTYISNWQKYQYNWSSAYRRFPRNTKKHLPGCSLGIRDQRILRLLRRILRLNFKGLYLFFIQMQNL